MTDALDLRAINAVAARLAAIDGTGDYNFNLAGRVFIGEPSVEPSDFPCVCVYSSGEAMQPGAGAEGAPSGASTHYNTQLNIEVEGLVAATVSNQHVQALKLKADIKRALFRYSQPSLTDGSGTLGPISYLSAEVVSRRESQEFETVRVNARVTYREAFGNPANTRITP